MKLAATFLTLMAAVLITIPAVGLRAGTAGAEGPPKVIFMFPHEGDIFAEPLKVIQMCFAEPINVKDLDKGGDFDFAVTPPQGIRLGLRIVFQPNGLGVAVYPGAWDDAPEGEWTFTWKVTAPETLEPLEGEIRYSVRAGGAPILQPTPADCSPDRTPSSPVDASPSPTQVKDTGEDGGPDVLKLALFTIGAAGGAALLALIGYAIRNRVGFWLHRPPQRKDGDGGHH